jgi:kumamolisin
MKSVHVWKVWGGFGCGASLATIFNRPAHHACINGYTLRLAGVVSLLALGLPLVGSAAPRQQLGGGHVPAAVARLMPAGSLPSTQRLNLAIGLPLRNEQELDALLQQLYDPASPNYHRYLTPEEFTARFGPTEKDYQALMDFAKSNRLTVTVTHPKPRGAGTCQTRP